MDFLPSVVAAEHVRDYLIRVSFNDGLIKVVDFEAWLRGPVFEPLKSPAYFRRFFLDGGTVAWPNGADIAPETLYQEPGQVEERPAAQREYLDSSVRGDAESGSR
jgi:hypothetical protein